jgi:spermidine/putrescine-binding protein
VVQRRLVPLALAALAVGALAGCGGRGEAPLRLVAYPGYADAASLPAFVRSSGCTAHVRVVRSATELLDVVSHGGEDVAAVSGDVVGVLEGGRQLASRPVPFVRLDPVLLWRTDVVRGRPRPADLWNGRFAGRVAVYDSPMQLAEAALRLGVRDPYELRPPRFAEVARLAARQRADVGSYWLDDVRAEADFMGGNAVVGLVPLRLALRLRADDVPVAWARLAGRRIGRVDSWAVLAGAHRPTCARAWLAWVRRPAVRARAARALSAAAAGPVRATDWRSPLRDCGAARCASWADWSDAWAAIRS